MEAFNGKWGSREPGASMVEFLVLAARAGHKLFSHAFQELSRQVLAPARVQAMRGPQPQQLSCAVTGSCHLAVQQRSGVWPCRAYSCVSGCDSGPARWLGWFQPQRWRCRRKHVLVESAAWS